MNTVNKPLFHLFDSYCMQSWQDAREDEKHSPMSRSPELHRLFPGSHSLTPGPQLIDSQLKVDPIKHGFLHLSPSYQAPTLHPLPPHRPSSWTDRTQSRVAWKTKHTSQAGRALFPLCGSGWVQYVWKCSHTV